MDGLDRSLVHSYEITSESRIHEELGDFFDSIYLNDHDETQKNGACKFSKSFSINTEFLNQDDLFCLTKVTARPHHYK